MRKHIDNIIVIILLTIVAILVVYTLNLDSHLKDLKEQYQILQQENGQMIDAHWHNMNNEMKRD